MILLYHFSKHSLNICFIHNVLFNVFLKWKSWYEPVSARKNGRVYIVLITSHLSTFGLLNNYFWYYGCLDFGNTSLVDTNTEMFRKRNIDVSVITKLTAVFFQFIYHLYNMIHVSICHVCLFLLKFLRQTHSLQFYV